MKKLRSGMLFVMFCLVTGLAAWAGGQKEAPQPAPAAAAAEQPAGAASAARPRRSSTRPSRSIS